MRDSILILGAAALQLPLIKYTKSRGFRVIVVSIPGHYPGFGYADRSIYCDIRDGEKILSLIKNENIVAVLTDQTDISVPTVAFLCDRLGLHGNSEKIAQIYSNKNLMRKVCDDIKIPNLRHICVSKIADAKDWDIYPAILKPEDSQGSRGVHKVNTFEELTDVLEHTLSFSYSGVAILEEFFVGNEIVVEGYVQDGKYINFGIGDRKYFDLPGMFIPSQTIFPTTINDTLIGKILDNERKIHSHLSPSFGMIHSEYLVNEQSGEFFLVETALRGGGVYISSHLIPLYTNFNNYDLLLQNALGNKVDLLSIEQSFIKKSSAYICFAFPEGEIISIEGVEDILNMEECIFFDHTGLEVGKYIGPMCNKTDRLGPIIVQSTNKQTMDSTISNIQQLLRVVVQGREGKTHSIIW